MIESSSESGARSLSTDRAGSRSWWFLGTLAVLRNPQGAPRTPTVIELVVPPGGSPPRHVHDNLDDSFLMLEGEVLVCCGGESFPASAGTYVALPAGIEHSFRVTGETPARMLLVHETDEFLDFIEAVGVPAPRLTLPEPGSTSLSREELVRASAAHGVRIVGPSLGE